MDAPQLVPVHVSFIMDGNGRWAKARGKERIFGHFEGVESVRAVLEASVEWGIKYVSFFAFSEENWGRPQEEVLGLMSLMMRSMKNELHSFLSNGIRFRVLGNLERLSDELRSEIAHMEEATASGDKMTMIIFMSYSGKWDLRQAAR
ncbi:MAG: di-trans,poly-cis-decaprenylcistransferase, partial [Bacteroidales bacterium]|nr:di-trans,poly-cis-decaprenylcistransferase [Bacteroidales bacterium]